ncbi:MAG: sensor histidine kinase [Thermodesulfobacteriota bacterium]
MKAFWKNPLVIDPLVALAATHVILAPISWYIEGTGAIAPAAFVEYALKPLALYLTVLSLAAGLVGGYHRRRVMQSAQALKELLEERESLLRVLSHDLSSSVGGSRMLVSLLRKDERRATGQLGRENLQSVENALGSAMDLIGLARRLMALEGGKMTLSLIPVDLSALVRECAAMNAGPCEAKNVSMKLDIEPGCREAMADPVSLMGCVMGNLVSNAVKFSLPGGEVRVGVRQAGNCLRVDVANIGAPVAEDRVASLFSFNGRTSTPGTAGEAGTGFGLPLARRFARLMGGDVVFSQVPAGSGLASIRFSVILPAATSAAKPRQGLKLVRKTPAAA